MGNRYLRIPFAIKVRDKGKEVTDIDAAVLDRTTGDLALFQIKWQDYATNDVRQLRSKAKNLSEEMDAWTKKVVRWLSTLSRKQLGQTLQLRENERISSVYIFGISRSVAQTAGYGFACTHPKLAMANWPQFCRIRTEIGPVVNAIQAIHLRLLEEAEASMTCKPLPVSLSIAGQPFDFIDLWNSPDAPPSDMQAPDVHTP